MSYLNLFISLSESGSDEDSSIDNLVNTDIVKYPLEVLRVFKCNNCNCGHSWVAAHDEEGCKCHCCDSQGDVVEDYAYVD